MGGSDDQVVVELVAQTSGFVQGMRDAASGTSDAARSINSGLTGISEGINDVVRDAAKLVGLTVGVEKIVELGKQSLETAEKVDRMSQSLGVSTDTVQTMGYAAALVGTSLDSMGGALAKMERSGEQAAAGNKQALEAFRAIGITGTQVAQLLKNPDEMIKVVTAHIASFADGSGKTAVTMQLLGRGAAENIPLINKLGAEYADLTRKAQAMGIVLGHDQTIALADAEDRLNDLDQQVHGLANRIMIEMLPALDAATQSAGDFLNSDSIKTGIAVFGQGVLFTVQHLDELKATMQALDGLQAGRVFMDAAREAGGLVVQSGLLREAFEKLRDIMPQINFDWVAKATAAVKDLGATVTAKTMSIWNDLTTGAANAKEMVKGAFSSMLGGANAAADAIARNNAAWETQDKKIKAALETTIASNHATKDLVLEQLQGAQAADALAKGTDEAKKKQIDYNAAVGIGDAQRKAVAEDTAKLMQIIEQLNGQVGGPSVAAFQQLEAVQVRVDEATAKLIADGGDAAKAEALHADATRAISAALKEKFEILNKDLAIGDKYLDSLRDQIKVLGMTETESKAYLDTQKLANEAIQKHVDLLGDDSGTIEEVTARVKAQVPAFQAQTQALLDQIDAYKKSLEMQKEYVSAIEGAGMDALKQFTDALSGAGDGFDKFGEHLKQDAKQLVSELLFTFFKLQVLGPFFASLFGQASGFWGMFGGGGGSMASMIPAGIAMAAGAGGGGAGVGAGVGGGSAGGGGVLGYAQQGWQAYQGWQALMGGVGGDQTLMGSMFGTGDFDVGWGNALSSGGGIGGALGTAGGALGGFYLGERLTGSTAGGIAGGVGLGVASYFVPIIGWIAGAIALIDMMTGGGLLGTDATFNKGWQNLNVGAGGFDIATFADMKGKKPLFGGSYHETKGLPTDPAQIAAIQEWFDSLNKNLALIGKKYGVEAGKIIDASFTEEFDKHGNVTKHTSTVGGETFNEDQSHFLERVTVLSEAATLDKLGISVTNYVNQFKQDADQMAEALKDAMATIDSIQTNIISGNFLLTGQKTLKDTWDYVQSVQMAGETMSQTYQRLEQAAQTYNQIMDTVNQGIFQMTQGGDPAAVFAATVANIDTNAEKMIAQLNAAAQAAGLSGAAEADLAKVHKYAALQAQQAIAQLQSAGASLVDSLYGTGTLEGINATIAAIEGEGNNALHGFANTISTVAQRASDAMNLLLGTLSPYNDEQKLQFALQGFYQGSVSKEQVLEIAQRLYASGQQYKDLFEQLSHYPDHVQNSGAPGGGGGGLGHTNTGNTHGLSRADLADLYAQRDAIQKQQRALQAQQLAATVAQLSNVQGQNYEAIAKELNFKLSDLAKDLGLKLSDLPAYLDNLKKNENQVPDTITSNTDRVVDILKKIFVAVGGDASQLDDTGTNGGAPSDGHSGHSGHARPGVPPQGPVHLPYTVHTVGAPDGPVTEGTMQQMVTEQRRTNDYLRRLPSGGDDRGIRTPQAR